MAIICGGVLLSFVWFWCGHATTSTYDSDAGPGLYKDRYLNLVNNTIGQVYRWHVSSEWSCNKPTLPPQYSPYLTYIVSASEKYGFTEQLILAYGANSRERFGETWIFDSKAESWEKLDIASPSQRPGYLHSVVTLCDSTVLRVSVPTMPNGQRPDVWMFDGETTAWKKMRVDYGETVKSVVTPQSGVLITLSMTTIPLTYICDEFAIAMAGNSSVVTLWKLTLLSDKAGILWDELQHNCDDCPQKVMVQSAAASKGLYSVFVLASTGLWSYYYWNEKWELTAAWSDDSGDIRAWCQPLNCVAESYLTMDYWVLSREHIWTYRFDAEPTWVTSETSGSAPEFFSGILWFAPFPLAYSGSSRKGCHPVLYKMNWNVWTIAEAPEVSPASTEHSAVAVLGSYLFTVSPATRHSQFEVYGPGATEAAFVTTLDLWLLNLDHVRWQRLRPYNPGGFVRYEYVSGIILHDTVYLVCVTATTLNASDSPVSFAFKQEHLHVLGYLVTPRRWILYNATHRPRGREQQEVGRLNASSLLLFGGYDSVAKSNRDTLVTLNDTWILSVPDPSKDTVLWVKVETNDSFPGPVGRFKHSMVRVDRLVVLYGGEDRLGKCLDDVWHFDILTLTWSRPSHQHESDVNGPRLSIDSKCHSFAAAVGKQSFFVIPCVEQVCSPIGLQLWMYLPFSNVWIMLSVSPDSSSTWSYSLFLWKDTLMIFDSSGPQLFYSYLGCPAGYASPNMSSLATPCTPCSLGYYSSSAARKCTPCPNNLLTKSEAAVSIYQCEVCDGYCQYGVCLVVQSDGQPRPACQCTLGFSGDHCQYPTYYLITFGVVVFLVVFATGIIVPVKIWIKRRNREKELVDHVAELQSVWQIKGQEVIIQERIGSGGYGEVFLAEYRNIPVAVKLLRLTGDESIVFEFEREIKFMQTIRHPNIVMFLGAGKMEGDETPFLVAEYMSRGSYRDLLNEVTTDVAFETKLRLCLDVAKGMEFLHELNPPRVHRDLKSDNLLISASWVGKIADFGLGKQIFSASTESAHTRKSLDRAHQHRIELSKVYSLAMPLTLSGAEAASHGVGAAKWRAPELSRNRSGRCSTAVDVYRY